MFPRLIACPLLLAGLAAHADVVSWNHNNFGDAYVADGASRATDAAGVVPATYWNDSFLDGRTADLFDDAGQETTLDLQVSSFTTWAVQFSHPGPDGDGSYNREILNGYLNSGASVTPTTSSLTLSQIPYSSYDLYVYFSSDVAGRTGSVSDGTTTYYFNTVGLPSIADASGNALFVQATETTEAGHAVAANYAVFSGLSGGSRTVTVDIPEFGGIAAIQVVGDGLPSVPQFVQQPLDQQAAVDADVSFVAAAPAEPASSYQWEYSADGNAGWAVLDGETLATLQLIGVRPADDGYYRVIASNANGTATSDVVRLEVFYEMPQFFLQPADRYATAGSTVEFTADAFTYGDPIYQWYKDGSPIGGETDYLLTITNVDTASAGEYFLRVTDSFDSSLSADSEVANLHVIEEWDGLVSRESFESASGYTPGGLPLQDATVAGYRDPWTEVDFGDAQPELREGSLVYPDPLYLGSSGDRAGKAADTAGIAADNSGRVYRNLAPELVVADSTSGVRYLSWLYRNGNENAADGATVHSTFSLYRDTGGASPSGDAALRTFEAGVSDADFGSTNYGFRFNDSQVGDLGVPLDGTVHLFVVKFELSDEFGADRMTVWLDPQLGSGEPTGGTTLEFLDITFDSLALSDYASNSSDWDEIRWGSSFDSVTLNPNPSAGFAEWIAGFPEVGELNGFEDDPDGDGLANGLENHFGSSPSTANPGVVEVARSGNTVTFVHPRNSAPAGDVLASYRWSPDLVQWNADGSSVGGTTVDFSTAPESADMVRVTATISGEVPEKLFVDLLVTLAVP